MAAKRPVEIELKYLVLDEAAARRLLEEARVGPFEAGPAHLPEQVEDRYVDAPDGALGRAGFAARLRRGREGVLLTLKSRSGGGSALHRREEIEAPAALTLDPAGWPPSPARSVVLELCGDGPLAELVTIRQVRRTRQLRATGAVAELSLDDVEIVDGGRLAERFEELEVELREGDEQPLHELAELLATDPGLTPSTTSKLERALAAVGRAPVSAAPKGGRDQPDAPRTPGVAADDTLAEAGRKVLRFHFGRLGAREAGARSGRDEEDVHAMRVATRRMRAAWRVFGEAFRPRRTRRLRSRLRVLADRLGTVRDLDVLLANLEGHRAGLDPAEAAGLEPLAAAWREQRDAARRLLVRELDSDDYRQLVEDYRVFVGTEGAEARRPSVPTLPHRVRDTAPTRIWMAYERVRGYERVLPWADNETLHRLRIEAKRFRYTLEPFREVLGPEAAGLIERVVALQDHLGLLHDADVAAGLARAFLVEHGARLGAAETGAIGHYLRHEERESARLRRSLGPAWRALVGVRFRRALGRAVAAL